MYVGAGRLPDARGPNAAGRAGRMGHGMKDFLRREDGVVALIFAVMAIPFIAMGGWAVDYLRMYHVKDYLQSQADAAALTALLEGVEQEDWEDAFRAEISRQYSGSWAD